MSPSRRIQRVEKELRQIVANYLLTGFKEPLEGLLSVSRVSVTPDLRQARVYVGMLGEAIDFEENLERLQARAGDFQREIARRLPMKYCPRLQFFRDDSTDKVLKVERLLKEIETQRAGSEGAMPG